MTFWLVAAVSLLATWLNIRRVRACFALWTATNLVWLARCWVHGLPEQAVLHAVYAGLAVWGWCQWRHVAAPAAPSLAGDSRGG